MVNFEIAWQEMSDNYSIEYVIIYSLEKVFY